MTGLLDTWSSSAAKQVPVPRCLVGQPGPGRDCELESRLIRRKFYWHFSPSAGLDLLTCQQARPGQASGIKFPWRSSGWSEPYLTDHLTYHNSYLTTTTQHLSNTSRDFHYYGYNRLVWTLVGDVGDNKKQTEHLSVGRQSFLYFF